MKRFLILTAVCAAACGSVSAAPKFEPTCASPAVFAPGVEDVAKISELRKAGKMAEGEDLLKKVSGSQQLQDMARFALYRDDKARTSEMNALLTKVVAADETSFWGTAALGLLRMRGAEPLTLYWPWKASQLMTPRTTVVYGVDHLFRKAGHYTIDVKGGSVITAIELNRADGLFMRLTPPFAFDLPSGVKLTSLTFDVARAADGELVVKRQILKPRASAAGVTVAGGKGLAATYIRRVVGEKTIAEIAAKEGGGAFLTRFFADEAWTEQFAGSGPWSCASRQGTERNLANAGKALKALDTLVWNDDGSILSDRAVRDLATALALNHGYDRDEEWLVEVYALYRDWLKGGSLVPVAKTYDVRAWREVLGFGQNLFLTADDYKWSHDFITTVAPEDCGALCWQCSYRSYNCFGDSVQGPLYYRPWEHRLLQQECRYYVGGVCGSLSKFGSLIAATHGVRSFTAGQPAHCAYLVWDDAKNRWNIAYSVTGHTVPHNSLGGLGFAAVSEQQRYYAHPDRMAAERLMWSGRYEEAMRKVPGNWCAAVAWLGVLDDAKSPIAAYEPYAKAVRETFAEMPSEGFQLLLPYLQKIPMRDARLKAACEALAALRESPAESVEMAYFDEIALTPLKQLFEKDVEALWTLFEVALDGQAGTKTFYRQTVNWGAANLAHDDASTQRYMAVLTASVEKTKEIVDYRDMLVTASKSGDIEMFRQVYALMDKFSPELNAKKTGKVWPEEKAGAVLLSCDGMLMTSATSHWDWPYYYRNALLPDEFVEGNAFHTGRETAPWGMVKLPGPAQVKAITVVNSGLGINRSRQIPLAIWTSEDGRNFTLQRTFTETQDEWTIEFPTSVKARYVKVGRVPGEKQEVFHLHKILVYGKMLY